MKMKQNYQPYESPYACKESQLHQIGSEHRNQLVNFLANRDDQLYGSSTASSNNSDIEEKPQLRKH